MYTFLNIIGGLLVGCVAIGFASIGIGCLLDRLAELKIQYDYRVGSEARRCLGQRFISESRWFSEDVRTMNAVRIIGEYLAENGNTNVDSIRDQWRKEIAPSAPKIAKEEVA